MIIAGATMVAAMACQSCIHAQVNSGPNIDNATILAASRALGERSQSRVNLVYSGTFAQTETTRHFGLQLSENTDLGLQAEGFATLNSRRLYSSTIMTDAASIPALL